MLLGGAYMLTRNLWMPMGLHAAWNFTQGEIFDVPVSGLDSHGLVEAQLSGPPLPVRRRLRARGVADRDGHRHRCGRVAGGAGGAAGRAGAAVVGMRRLARTRRF